jgi:type I restriction enzyme, S subunit
MNPELLLTYFARISDAPDAVPRLRRFILDLAVRGKMVKQDPNDEPATELLKQIQLHKMQTVKGAKIKKPSARVAPDELPFSAPPGWAFAQISSFCELENGDRSKNYPSRDEFVSSGVPFINAGHLRSGEVCPTAMNYIPESRFNLLKSGKVRNGDILFCLRGSLGKSALVNNISRGAIASSLVIIRILGQINPHFVMEYLFSSLAVEMIGRFDNGTAQPNLSSADLGRFILPLPPLAEQHRIVAKVDELMALCDRLEAARAERESRRDRLTAASNHHINNGADLEALRKHSHFFIEHIPRLTARPDQIKQLRQTLRNLGVRGQLVPQDANDEPVLELLRRMKLEESDTKPFPLPTSWAWVSVGQIGESRLGKMLDKSKNKGTPRRYLRNVNVRWFDFDLSDVFEMRFEDSELDEFELHRGDVLICEGGEPGRAAVWDEREKGIYFQKAIHRVRFGQGVEPRFFAYAIRESAESGRLSAYFTGVGIKHFTGKGLSSFIFPVAPLAEQRRIVARLDELMTYCDTLEAQLTTARIERSRLLKSVLHLALHGATSSDWEKESSSVLGEGVRSTSHRAGKGNNFAKD